MYVGAKCNNEYVSDMFSHVLNNSEKLHRATDVMAICNILAELENIDPNCDEDL